MKVLVILLVLYCDCLVFNLSYYVHHLPAVAPVIWLVCSTLFLLTPFMRRP